jgi:hypothetical protein
MSETALEARRPGLYYIDFIAMLNRDYRRARRA